MRLDISRVLTHDNYTLEFDCSEDFSARETADGSRPFAAVRVYGTVRMRYDGVRLQATIKRPAPLPAPAVWNPSGSFWKRFSQPSGPKAAKRPTTTATSSYFPENGRYVELSEPVYDALLFAYPSKGALQRRLQGPVPGLRLQPQYRAVFLCVRRVGKSLSAFCILLFPMRRCHRCHKKERRPKPGEICVAPAFETGSAGAHQVRPVRRIDSGSQSL